MDIHSRDHVRPHRVSPLRRTTSAHHFALAVTDPPWKRPSYHKPVVPHGTTPHLKIATSPERSIGEILSRLGASFGRLRLVGTPVVARPDVEVFSSLGFPDADAA